MSLNFIDKVLLTSFIFRRIWELLEYRIDVLEVRNTTVSKYFRCKLFILIVN